MSETILYVGAHHEEMEAECPNTPALLAEAGCRVVFLNPVGGWNWTAIRQLGPSGREDTIRDATAAAAVLGCEKVIWDYPIQGLEQFRSEILQRMADFMLDLKPSIVMMHWPLDTHPDHRYVAKLTKAAIGSAVNLVPDLGRSMNVREIYAFQTGIFQAYNYTPDLLVTCTDSSMAKAHKCLDCFRRSVPQMAEGWRKNVLGKTAYWGINTGVPTEALKFMGPKLPLDGFLLKKILGDKLISMPTDQYYRNDDLY